MASEKVDISVLVVDDDDTSLAIITNILNSFDYKVLIARGALNALDILREFQGFLDLVITELHISGMDGVEFQKRIENEFQLPVIMMSADRRKSAVAKSLANGAAHFILKPFCQDDFKDIWQHAVAARKRKISIENNEGASLPGGGVFIQDANYAIPSTVNKRKRKYKSSQKNNKEGQSEGKHRLVKKPKIVWTAYLHNIFLLAIKRIGLERAVPKRILEVMNVPNLTRENVASHLQKYRIFLRKVADKGLIEGLSNRDLKSRFASGLSPSVIRDFQAATAKARVPVQQYMKRLAHQSAYGGIANALKPYNHVSRSTSYVTTTFGRSNQFPYSLHKGLNMRVQHQHGDSLNQARLGMQSSFATNNAGANYNNIQQKMLGSYANSSYYSKSSCNNVGAVFQSNGTMGHGLITANGLRGGVKYGNQQLMNQNYGTSLENYHKFSYDQVNWNMGSLNYSNNNNLTWNSTTYNTNGNIQQNGGSQVVGNGMKGEYNNAVGTTDSIANNSNNNLTWNSTTYDTSSSIQQNGGSQVVGNGTKGGYNNTIGTLNSIANNNSFGLIKGTTQNTNRNVVAPLGQGNSGLAQGGFASASASIAMDYVKSSDHLPPAFITNNGTGAENVSVNQQRSQQQNVNVAGNVTSIGEGDFNHLADEVDLSDLFLMIDEMDILIETGENPNASELPKSDFSNSTHAVQSHEQSNSGSDMIIDQTESTLNVSNESPTSSDKNSNQLGGYSGFLDIESLDRFMVDDVSSARDSATYQDWDMDFIETLFAAETN